MRGILLHLSTMERPIRRLPWFRFRDVSMWALNLNSLCILQWRPEGSFVLHLGLLQWFYGSYIWPTNPTWTVISKGGRDPSTHTTNRWIDASTTLDRFIQYRKLILSAHGFLFFSIILLIRCLGILSSRSMLQGAAILSRLAIFIFYNIFIHLRTSNFCYKTRMILIPHKSVDVACSRATPIIGVFRYISSYFL